MNQTLSDESLRPHLEAEARVCDSISATALQQAVALGADPFDLAALIGIQIGIALALVDPDLARRLNDEMTSWAADPMSVLDEHAWAAESIRRGELLDEGLQP